MMNTVDAAAALPADGLAPAVGVGWDAVLADGDLVHLRPATPDDNAALRSLHAAASDRSIYLRYFTGNRHAAEAYVDRLLAKHPDTTLALVAEQQNALVGVASCERLPGTADAEVAFLVADRQQHRGIGTLLLENLAALARRHGIRRFVAETLAENGLMLQVFADAGFVMNRQMDGGVVEVAFPIAPTELAQAAVDAREHAADVRCLRRVLAPRSVVIVGASDRPESVGGALLHNVLAAGFTGAVYAVNRRAQSVAGMPAYPSVADLPEPVDLAVVAVRADAIPAVLTDCGARGVPAAVLVTAGFGETGSAGALRERELLRLARRLGIRLVGPNCLGVACTDPAVRLNATFARTPPTPGRLGFASQSGALGIALLEASARRGLGMAGFVSLGNKVDVSGNDLLLYWEDDPNVGVIALYLESFGNPRKFLRHAARISRRKPILALKAGRTEAGGRAGRSHTAAVATPDVLVTALLDQAGVIRVDNTAELLDAAVLLSEQPVPAGRRIGILGNSGGPGILAADAADGFGLVVPELSANLRRQLVAAAPRLAAAANPVDLGAAASPGEFEQALRLLTGSGEVDAVVVIYAAPLVTDPEEIATAIRRGTRTAGQVPVVAALFGAETPALRAPQPDVAPIPVYEFPEAAVRAVGLAARYGGYRDRRTGTIPRLDVDVDAARTLVVEALAAHPDGTWLDQVTAVRLVTAFGIPACPTRPAYTADEAVTVAEQVGYPVAVKVGAGAVHKIDIGGLQLNLRTAEQVRQAFGEVSRTGLPGAAVVIQPMAAAGVELLIGCHRMEPYPPAILVGLGGTATELLADRVVRLAPLTDSDAHAMPRQLRAAPLLFGYRGAEPVDVAAVSDLLLRLSSLVEELPEVAELDLNPVIAGPSGVTAVDVKVRLAPSPDDGLLRDPLVRRLR